MNLTEIISLIKEITDNYPDLEGDDFLLAPSKLAASPVEGYEIHMTGKFSETARKYLNNLALQKQLSITQHPDSIMIYKAKKVEAKKPLFEEA